MEKEKSPLIELISWAIVAGNILFVLWILYNGINENFQGTLLEKVSYITLMGLLVVNAFLLPGGSRKKEIITTKGMKEEKASLREFLSWAAITGNILFMLWMTYRRISESFKGTIYQQISYIGLMGLLSVTIVLLRNRRK
jgi:uncharacterized membrane protein YjfL (UPF0719 family)